jgi:dienelactone hydrolase
MKAFRSTFRLVAALLAVATLATAGLVADPATTGAQTNPFQRGPAPTAAALERDGPFAVQQQSVASNQQAGFNGGTIFYPTDTSQGTFGAVAVSPGFFTPGSAMNGIGRRVATHGFVVIVINTWSGTDFPASRGMQMAGALYWLATASTVRERLDQNRLGVMGHSMGGGGSLEVAKQYGQYLDAVVPLQPWSLGGNYSTVQVPTLLIGAQNDSVASPTAHAEPFFTQIPAASEKAYLELAGASHGAGLSTGNAPQSRLAVAWLKRWIDRDTRYEQFLCNPPPSVGTGISEYRHSCPHGS